MMQHFDGSIETERRSEGSPGTETLYPSSVSSNPILYLIGHLQAPVHAGGTKAGYRPA